MDWLDERAAGVLMHPTSLPSPHGIGDLGDAARSFVAFLAAGGQRVWQMLPVGPVGWGNSPYSAQSTFAGNPLLISLEDLARDGFLDAAAIRQGEPAWPSGRVDFGAVGPFHNRQLLLAFARFARGESTVARSEFIAFCDENEAWLEDFALYAALKRAHGGASFLDWTPPLATRNSAALDGARRRLAEEVEFHRFEQWLFARQWRAIVAYAHERGVMLVGDLPIFVAGDSADVWAHPDLFQLGAGRRPTVVAGVPPDYFSATGQLWGNPLYRWGTLKRRGYGWWIDRLAATLARFDAVRLDHFIGFVRSWAVPAAEATAEHGHFQRGPGEDLFRAVARALGTPISSLPFIAEDLGLVTPEVRALRERLGLPGIRVLQFAFGTDENAAHFKPHNYERRAMAVTGTHDNDTTVGWFRGASGRPAPALPSETDRRSIAEEDEERAAALAYLGDPDPAQIHWAMIRALYASVANLVVVPMQDLLGLGSEARMNRPGQPSGNWEWRMSPSADEVGIAERLARLGRLYDRAPARRVPALSAPLASVSSVRGPISVGTRSSSASFARAARRGA